MVKICKLLLFWLLSTALFLFLALFVIFLGVDSSQQFRNVIGMKKIPFVYFSSKFVRDDELIFLGNPNWNVDTTMGEKYATHPIFHGEIELIPYKANFNSRGYRESTSPLTSPVVVLGDSFIEGGDTNDDTFAEHLKKSLGQEVANYGLSWYGPEQYLLTLKKHALQHHPETVIVSFYEGNDPEDTDWYKNWQESGFYYRQGFTAKHRTLRLQYFYSDIFEFARTHTMQAFRNSLAQVRNRYRDPIKQRLIQVELPGNAFPDLIAQTADTVSSSELLLTQSWARIREIMGEFASLSQKENFKLLLMHIPRKTHVYAPYISYSESGSYWKELMKKEPRESARWEALNTICKEFSIRCVSLLPEFQDAARNGIPTFYQTDLHWNSQGRKIAANRIAKLLADAHFPSA